MENKLEDLEKKYEELGKEIKKLKREQEVFTSFKNWRAEHGEEYYYIEDSGDINTENETEWGDDDFRYNTGNYFMTEKDAEDVVKKLIFYNQLKDFAKKLNNGVKIEWENVNQSKYYIYYSAEGNFLDFNCTATSKRLGDIYSLDGNFLSKAIAEFGEEQIKNLFRN